MVTRVIDGDTIEIEGDQTVDEVLVPEGYTQLSTFPPGAKYADLFRALLLLANAIAWFMVAMGWA